MEPWGTPQDTFINSASHCVHVRCFLCGCKGYGVVLCPKLSETSIASVRFNLRAVISASKLTTTCREVLISSTRCHFCGHFSVTFFFIDVARKLATSRYYVHILNPAYKAMIVNLCLQPGEVTISEHYTRPFGIAGHCYLACKEKRQSLKRSMKSIITNISLLWFQLLQMRASLQPTVVP